jgi:hypothetical protein
VGCHEHISAAYSQLGQPEVNFSTFWEVYNHLRDAVDSDILFQSATDRLASDGENNGENSDGDQLPLSHLLPCEFGQNGVPAGKTVEVPVSSTVNDEGSGTHAKHFFFTSKTPAYCSLECSIMVEFTDDDGDELF